MSWMFCIWINWVALLFVKVWWSKHSKLVTLFGTVVIFSGPLAIDFCELASQKPKKSHLERRSTAVWCNTGAAPGHLNLRWWGLYMKFRDYHKFIDGGWPFLTYFVPFSTAHCFRGTNERCQMSDSISLEEHLKLFRFKLWSIVTH